MKEETLTILGDYWSNFTGSHRKMMTLMTSIVGLKIMFLSKTSLEKIKTDMNYLKNKLGIKEDILFDDEDDGSELREYLYNLRKKVIEFFKNNNSDGFMVYANKDFIVHIYEHSLEGVQDFVKLCNSITESWNKGEIIFDYKPGVLK